ncbi:hypothetical protein REH70_17625 [Cellulomonas sp. ATA003]|nr:hypothetical protein [Cellulomonas sp. ATA003]WNB85386.1 hypothetical protein REH70_17625 [Cellulomonas sp. ATA003]
MTDLAAPSLWSSDDADRRHADEEERESERSEVRRAVARFLLTGLATLAVVAAPATLALQHLVQTHTLEGLEETTSRMAENMVAPLVDERLLAGDPDAVALLDRVLHSRIAGGSVIRITVWTRSGQVLFSDASWLVGQRFPDHEWVDILPPDGGAVARFEDPDSPVDEHSEDLGHAVEVDAPFVADSGDRLVLEAHFPAAVVHAQERDLLLSLLPVGVVTLVALQLAQLPRRSVSPDASRDSSPPDVGCSARPPRHRTWSAVGSSATCTTRSSRTSPGRAMPSSRSRHGWTPQPAPRSPDCERSSARASAPCAACSPRSTRPSRTATACRPPSTASPTGSAPAGSTSASPSRTTSTCPGRPRPCSTASRARP